MGGGLAFLNKKTWHPGRFQNQEEVWKREQAALAEAKKLEELRKQMEEERKHHEMQEIAVAAGHKKEGDRMDWMYQGGLAAQQDAAKRADEHLLGKAAALPAPQVQAEVSKCEEASNLPSFMASAAPASQNETWARLNNDPLLLIKKRQQDQLKTIKDNPVKMQQIIQEIQAGKHKDKKSKNSKKEKKEKKSKKSRRSSSSSSDSEGQERRARHAPTLPPGSMGPPPSHGHERARGMERGDVHQHREPSRGLGHGQPVDDRRKRFRSRSRSRSADRTTGYDRSRQHEGAGRRHDMTDADRRGNESRPHSRSVGHRQDRHEYDARDAPRHGAGRSPPREGGRSNGNRHSRDERDAQAGHKHSAGRSPPRDEHDARPKQDSRAAGDRYGLSHSTTAPEQLRQNDGSQRAAETRARLEEGARKREEDERAKLASRHQKREYRTGQLTEEERQKRLAEMMSNANEHEQQRTERLQRAKDADKSGEGQLVANVGGVGGREGDAFAKAASRDVFAALTASGGSLEARVSSRKHFNAR